MSFISIFSISSAATALMLFYLGSTIFGLYRLMYPLSAVDLSTVHASEMVKPLWDVASEMHLRVYLAAEPNFSMKFFESEFPTKTKDDYQGADASDNRLSQLLWDQKLDSPAFSKSFMLTTLDCDSLRSPCERDISYKFAASWLELTENTALERSEGGLLGAMSVAGKGIESTSFLLILYQSLSKRIRSLFFTLPLPDRPSEGTLATASRRLDRARIFLSRDSPLWSRIISNSTLYLHVLLLRSPSRGQYAWKWPPSSLEEARASIRQASRSHSLLTGRVEMMKFDTPHHIGKPRRILYFDLVHLWNKYVMNSQQHAPWDFAHSKPVEYKLHRAALEMKRGGATYPYWKPEVSVKYVNDRDQYPINYAGVSGMPIVKINRDSDHMTGYAFLPVLHVDEIGLTSEKYIPVNDTLTSLPLRISFDRSDIEHLSSASTVAAGGMSPARLRLMSHLSQSIEAQKQLGFEQSDIDDVRRLIADTNVTLLAITLLASTLHLLFEFLTFKSEVSFWSKNKDLTGLSVRSLFLDTIGQIIILLFLIEKDSSLLMIIPSGFGCLIAVWKCRRAAGLAFVKRRPGRPVSWINLLPVVVGYELRALRLEMEPVDDEKKSTVFLSKNSSLSTLTFESDRIATRTLGAMLLPLVIAYALYSFMREEHQGWYSWMITTASSAVYALGFVLMTPQLFLNWKLKSVAHLPWRVLVYKSLNTFIDDLFSFIIRMPTMARISCFRDDVVFFVYLYQRWLYPVDKSRPVEGGVGEQNLASVEQSGAWSPEGNDVHGAERKKKME